MRPCRRQVPRQCHRARAPDDFDRDSDLFREGVRNSEAQNRIQAAVRRDFQARHGEMALARIFDDLAYGQSNT